MSPKDCPAPRAKGQAWRDFGAAAAGEPGYSQNGIVDLYSFVVSLLDVNVIMYVYIYIYTVYNYICWVVDGW